MRLLKLEGSGDIRLTSKLSDRKLPPYAILSHTWGCDEVTFEDLEGDIGRSKAGYQKIEFCGKQAARDKLHHFWVDTCCINKSSEPELTSSLNSMFRWYRDATKCYVYLSDVSACIEDNQRPQPTWAAAFRRSRWFTRGWTLQELLAPESVEFFSMEGVLLGNKISLVEHILDITGIPVRALLGDLRVYSTEERISWIKDRETEEKEDKAYCLLGICDVFMPIIYGEGEENAFRRLRREIRSLEEGEGEDRREISSSEEDEGEESWSKWQEAREMDGRCRNCGSSNHWESQCWPRVCGRCEIFSKCQTNGVILSADARSTAWAYCLLLSESSMLYEM